VQLTVKRKTRRTDTYGEVRWNVDVVDQDGEAVAEYDLLTMVRYRDAGGRLTRNGMPAHTSLASRSSNVPAWIAHM
jgi:hypothetical protein